MCSRTALPRPPQPGIQGIPQPVAEEVERHHHDGNRQAGIGVTALILLLRGFFRLGQLFQRIDAQDESIQQMREDIREIRGDIRQLAAEMRESNQQSAAEMRQTNETVIALANHRHDQDGNIIFILPVQPGG